MSCRGPSGSARAWVWTVCVLMAGAVGAGVPAPVRADTSAHCVTAVFPLPGATDVPSNARIFVFGPAWTGNGLTLLLERDGMPVRLQVEASVATEPSAPLGTQLAILRPFPPADLGPGVYTLSSPAPLTCFNPWASTFTVSGGRETTPAVEPRLLGAGPALLEPVPGAVAYALLVEGKVAALSPTPGFPTWTAETCAALKVWMADGRSMEGPVECPATTAQPWKAAPKLLTVGPDVNDTGPNCASVPPETHVWAWMWGVLVWRRRRRWHRFPHPALAACALACGAAACVPPAVELDIQVDMPSDDTVQVRRWQHEAAAGECRLEGQPRRCVVRMDNTGMLQVWSGSTALGWVQVKGGQQQVHMNPFTALVARAVPLPTPEKDLAATVRALEARFTSQLAGVALGLTPGVAPDALDSHGGGVDAALYLWASMAWSPSPWTARRTDDVAAAVAEHDRWLQSQSPRHRPLDTALVTDVDQDGVPDAEDPCPLWRAASRFHTTTCPRVAMDWAPLDAVRLSARGPVLLLGGDGNAVLVDVSGNGQGWSAPWVAPSEAPTVVDLDVDGNMDVLVWDQAWRGDGAGGFVQEPAWAPPSGCFWTVGLDLDGDGDEDALDAPRGCRAWAAPGGPRFAADAAPGWTVDINGDGQPDDTGLPSEQIREMHTVDGDGTPPRDLLVSVGDWQEVPKTWLVTFEPSGALKASRVLVNWRVANPCRPLLVPGRTPGDVWCGTFGLEHAGARTDDVWQPMAASGGSGLSNVRVVRGASGLLLAGPATMPTGAQVAHFIHLGMP